MLKVLFFLGFALILFALVDWIIEVWQKHQQREVARYNSKLELKPRGKQR